MPIDATAGGTTANSYVTMAEAVAYFVSRSHADPWLTAQSLDRESALITATRRIDQEDFIGQPATRDQALRWPRYDVYVDSLLIESTVIPQRVKDAQCEMAMELLRTDALEQSELTSFRSLKIGPISLEMNQPVSSGPLPSQVFRLLRDLMGANEVVRS